MNFTKTMFALAIGSVGVMGAMSAQAVALNNNDVLNIDAGVAQTMTIPGVGTFVTGYSGSWFGMDTNNNGIEASEKTALSAINSPGIVIGATSTAGPYGNGVSLTGSAGPIVDTWSFFSSTGTNFATVGITGSTEAGLDMSGWSVAWNNVPYIDMGQGANATFVWNGLDGGTYTLDYQANVPTASPAFPGVFYQLHLEGTVTQAAAVPEASTYGMMLAGLGLVGFAVRRRKLMA
ncbi:MAG: PEP-CTERM sorting domain-containing protein [Thiobacillus sp.]